MVLHYSDIDNPEDYSSGSGVHLLFSSLFTILQNHAIGQPVLTGLSPLLEKQYDEMFTFLHSQWKNMIDFLPSEKLVNISAYPRLQNHLSKLEHDLPVFVYVSNSLKPGRLFGDPFTGQLSAYSTALGKFDSPGRMVVAYFPHQVHTQAITAKGAAINKGMTLMTELTDFIIFHSRIVVNLRTQEVM